MKKILIGSLLILFSFLEGSETRFKLYCFYTPLFQPLYEDYFLPSLKDEYNKKIKEP